MPAGSASTSLSITNPLVLYRALVATNKIKPDPAQHRLALQLQKLYFRLKDYSPELEYRHRLDQISRSLPPARNVSQQRPGPLQRPPSPGFLSSLLWTSDGRSTLSLTRTIPIHDSAVEIDSPQGMLLYGEVGRGKSMLLDLLYSSLPSRKKRRWHFNTFMLDIFRRLELSRIERITLNSKMDHEHSILTLAKDTIATSPILFLDEFQMPDRAASKLLNGFMTRFFHLGGVLVASSNRMPDELAKASGIEFKGNQAQTKAFFGWGMKRMSEGEKGAQGDFGMFLEVLKARCEVWEMEGERDWRREVGEEEDLVDEEGIEMLTESVGPGEGTMAAVEAADVSDSVSESPSSDSPPHYHLSIPDASPTPFAQQVKSLNPSGEWVPTTLHIYSRPLQLQNTNSGVAVCAFNDLCATNLGPADYTSLCSQFHTIVLTNVPVLTLLLKNEARRFITLLDALYEARCRLLIEAAAPPDKLFFPELRTRHAAGPGLESGDSIESEAYSEMYQDSTAPFRPNVSSYKSTNESDPIESEAYSEMYQDSTAPFRPNISSYSPSSDTSATPTLSPQSQLRSVLADEDADFGPTYGNGRSHGARTNDLERLEHQQAIGPDFTNLSGLTGQDEMFAFKRARSRLWEMCGRKWWRQRSGAPEEWWMPIHQEGRFWEKTQGVVSKAAGSVALSGADVELMEGSHDGSRSKADDLYRDQDGLFKHGASPYRVVDEPPPKFAFWHAWGMGQWGRKGSGRARELRREGRGKVQSEAGSGGGVEEGGAGGQGKKEGRL